MKKSQDDILIEEVKYRAGFAAGCEPGQHCAIVELGIEATSNAGCNKVARAIACLNGRKGEAQAVPVLKTLSSGVYAAVALGPYDTELDADLAGVRASQALAQDEERRRQAAEAEQEAEIRREVAGQASAEEAVTERRRIEAERERASRATRAAAGMER